MGFQGWRSMINNFAYEVGGVDGMEFGIIQSLREVPGFLVFLVVFLLLIVKEHRLASISVFLMGLGIAIVGFFPSLPGLILTTVLMSVGFHYFETVNKSLTLQHFEKTESPLVFTQLRAYGALGNMVMGGVVVGLTALFDYKLSFLIVGALVMAAAIFTMIIDPLKEEPIPQHKKIVLRRKYWLFYVLNFLSGARRQIFIVFAVFLLVERHHFSVKEIAILFVANNILNYFLNPLIGKSINRFGERKVLSVEYIGLVFVFLGYVFIEQRWIIALLYILDHVFFNFSIGINTYLHKIADPKDIAPSASIGFAINHIAAVFIPVLGGMLWLYNYKIPFIAGAVMCVISLGFVQLIQLKGERPTQSS